MSRTNSKHTAVNLLPADEQALRLGRLCSAMLAGDIHDALIRDNANIFYLTGRVFRGYIYVDADKRTMHYFVRQPNHLTGENIHFIHKPEQIKELLVKDGVEVPEVMAFDLDSVFASEAQRLAKAFGMECPGPNASGALRTARSVKTKMEQDMLRASGVKQSLVYTRIPHLYQPGMTDIEFQIEIERALRLEGCLGQFRVAGADMEIFMGNVLTGENADTPSPYDFAMGGAGPDPSIPVGADGTLIRPGFPVMVDMNGNFNGYMTDMTRCFAPEEPNPEAVAANKLSVKICNALADKMRPGAAAADLYNLALQIATEAGMADSFMGHRSHAGFVGHGVGIQINELPVLAPRSKAILEAGNVIALEPKFVIPGLGAVGIENTYIVKEDGPAEVITTAPVDIISLEE